LLTFFRKGKLKKFFKADSNGSSELTFFDAVELFKCDQNATKVTIPKEFYELLDRNKKEFDFATSEEAYEKPSRHGSSNEAYVVKRLKTKEFKNYQGFTDEDDEYLKSVLRAFDSGVIPRNASKRIKELLEKEVNPIKMLNILKKNIPLALLDEGYRPKQYVPAAAGEVILSEYLCSGE